MKKTDLSKLLDYSKLRFKVKKAMRYDDVGDYYGSTIISYDMKNPVYTNGIMLHEFIEYNLITSAGIPVEMIDAFDTDDKAPKKHPKEYKLYRKYHRMANTVERHFIENMGVKWADYQKAVYTVAVKIKPAKKMETNVSKKTDKVR